MHLATGIATAGSDAPSVVGTRHGRTERSVPVDSVPGGPIPSPLLWREALRLRRTPPLLLLALELGGALLAADLGSAAILLEQTPQKVGGRRWRSRARQGLGLSRWHNPPVSSPPAGSGGAGASPICGGATPRRDPSRPAKPAGGPGAAPEGRGGGLRSPPGDWPGHGQPRLRRQRPHAAIARPGATWCRDVSAAAVASARSMARCWPRVVSRPRASAGWMSRCLVPWSTSSVRSCSATWRVA